MTNGAKTPSPALTGNPLVGYYFCVTFFVYGETKKALDIRFRKVSGIKSEVTTTKVTEGGENLFTHRLPERLSYGNLTLERGYMLGSPMADEIDKVMTQFAFSGSNVLVSMLNEKHEPKVNWLFMSAYPVKWSLSDLDAEQGKLAIDTMELAYTRFQRLK